MKLVDSVWFVETEAGSEVARIDTITDLLNEIRQIVTREFPEEEELVELDWNIPHAMMAIEVAEGSSSRSVLLSFLQKGAHHDREDSKKQKQRRYQYNISIFLLDPGRDDIQPDYRR